MSTILLSFEDVAFRVGLGRTRIYAGVTAGDFPKPVKIGRRSLWVEAEIDQWIADRIAERDVGQNMGSHKAA